MVSGRAKMELPSTLKKAAALAREVFFPQWDRARRWRIRTGRHSSALGFCDRARRVVLVAPTGDDLCRLQTLLHEISHAITGGGHGATWRRRHGQAANQADPMGLEGLGRAIRAEIAQYEQTPRTLAPEVYVTLEDAVSEARGGSSFAAVVRALAAQYGMTPGELRSRYSRLRRVYDAAVREARAEEQRGG